MSKKIIPFFIFFALSGFSGCTFTGEDNGINPDVSYAGNLIKSFGSLCPTHGNWSSISLSETRKIQNLLVSLRDDPKCKNIAHSLATHVDYLSTALHKLNRTDPSGLQISSLERQQLEILQLLKDIENDDSDENFGLREELKGLFSNNQLELALNKGSLSFIEKSENRKKAARVLIQSTEKIFEQAILNQQCLGQSPEFLSSLTALGSSLAFATGSGSALSLAVTSHFLGSTFEFFRQSDLNKQLSVLNEGEFSSAYQCVIESLSNQWCDARETYELIDLKMKNEVENSNPFLKGIKILNNDVPIFISWLRKVSSASEPKNTSVSTRQSNFLKRENNLKVWRSDALGTLGNAVENLPSSLATEESRRYQFTILQSAIGSMVPPSYEGDPTAVTHPLYDTISSEELPWLLIGLAITEIPTVEDHFGNRAVLNFGSLTPEIFRSNPALTPFYPLSAEVIKNSIKNTYESTFSLLSAKRNDILHTDPKFLFWDVENIHYAGVPNKKGISPRAAIDNILDYLKSSTGGGLPSCISEDIYPYDSSNQQKIVAETQHTLCRIREQIDNKTLEYQERLKNIFSVARLQNGEVYMQNRIQNIIKVIISEYLKRDDQSVDQQQQQILLLANNLVSNLELYGSSNMSQVKLDIVNALSNTQATLQNFAEIFSEGINQTFTNIHANNKNDPFSERLINRYCSLLLAVPDWSSKELKGIDLSLCKGRALRSEWRDTSEPFEFEFSEKSFQTPFGRERMCYFRRFLRQEKYYQSYRSEFR